MAPVVGLEPERADSSELTDSVDNCANSIQNSAFRDPEEGRRNRAITEPGHNFAEEQQQNGVPAVYRISPSNDPRLGLIADAWESLGEPIKEGLVAMVRASRPN